MSSTWAFGGIDRGLDGQHLIVGRPLPRRYIFSIRLGSRGVKAQPTGCLDSVLAYVIQHGSQQDSKAHQLLLGSQTSEHLQEEDVLVPGETVPENDDPNAEGTIPIRFLSDFSVFDTRTRVLQHLDTLLDLEDEDSSTISALGLVSAGPAACDSDDSDTYSLEDDTEPVGPVLLLKVLELSVHSVSEDASDKMLDRKIYLRTKHAWYILEIPSSHYRPLYANFWVKHSLAHLCVSAALQDEDITYDGFVSLLESGAVSHFLDYDPMEMVGQDLTAQDVNSSSSYISSVLSTLHQERSFKSFIKKVPLLKGLMKGSCFPRGVGAPKPHRDIEKEILYHKNDTVVTPRVGVIAEDLFQQTLHMAGSSIVDPPGPFPQNRMITRAHHHNPESIQWVLSSETHPHFYNSVIIDGVQYNVGDTVTVEMGEDDNATRSENSLSNSSRSSNELANTKWFAKICFMFESRSKKYFHAQWYQHGAHTILQESAHPHSLFLIQECEDQPLECIFQKCHLQTLGNVEDETVHRGTRDEDLFSGVQYNQTTVAFTELSNSEVATALKECEPHRQCISCGLERLRDQSAQWTAVPGRGLMCHGDDLLHIAQIREFTISPGGESPTATVRLLGRFSDVAECNGFDRSRRTLKVDQHDLFYTDTWLAGIDIDCLEGKVYICHPRALPSGLHQSWSEFDDHFVVGHYSSVREPQSLKKLEVISPEEVSVCTLCHLDHISALKEQKELLHRHGPLRGLELFAGAGGLSTGLEASGFVQTKWAVEFSPSAALSYQANHSKAVVYNQCSNLLLRHAIETFGGQKSKPLFSLHTAKPQKLPPMPSPGEVDFIYGGPPCQGFSGMNHNRKADDIRTTLVCNMLSYVEFYKPKYFLLENVVGLLRFPLRCEQVGNSLVGGIKMGVVKFILRSLVALGYQGHFKVLYSNHYGSPQSRARVIFWGARRDMIIPQFPIPTHCLHDPFCAQRINLPTGDVLYPATRAVDIGEDTFRHQCAPFRAPSIDDAISDLPKFDWKNPHKLMRQTKRDERELHERIQSGISQFDAISQGSFHQPGYPKPTPYLTPPLNEYQAWMRKGTKNKVMYHYTAKFSVKIVERVVNVPLEPLANHKDLPEQLFLGAKFYKSSYKTLYQRLDGAGPFATALTQVKPSSKGGNVLHPHQKRVYTVRECARCQGFPDTHQFLSVNKKFSDQVVDQHRQIGNAVPVQLALALGKELGKVLIKQWKLEDEEMEAGRVMSPEIGIDLQEEYDEEEEDMEMQMEYAETEDVEVEMLEDDEEDGDADDESVDPISQF